MRNEIQRVQAERDDADRQAVQPEGAETPSAKAAPAGPSGGRAPLTIDSPGDSPASAIAPGEGEDTEDPTPRPTFRIAGSPRAGRGGWGEDETTATVTSTLDPEAKHAYDAALALVTSKQCDKALGAFAAFLVKWPDHPYADNAMFWRGECYLQAADYAHATEQFEGVLARFPGGNKAPDALLKLGLAQEKLGNAAKARESFDKLLHLYPQSDAARRIPAGVTAGAATRGPAPPEERR
jgi:tol-pal system protein YbgF